MGHVERSLTSGRYGSCVRIGPHPYASWASSIASRATRVSLTDRVSRTGPGGGLGFGPEGTREVRPRLGSKVHGRNCDSLGHTQLDKISKGNKSDV